MNPPRPHLRHYWTADAVILLGTMAQYPTTSRIHSYPPIGRKLLLWPDPIFILPRFVVSTAQPSLPFHFLSVTPSRLLMGHRSGSWSGEIVPRGVGRMNRFSLFQHDKKHRSAVVVSNTVSLEDLCKQIFFLLWIINLLIKSIFPPIDSSK